jgi:hypothetical protein
MVNYSHNGRLVVASSFDDLSGAKYENVSGQELGLCISADAYFTPLPFWGLAGIGLYGCLLPKGQSYFAIDLSFIELNVGIPTH